MLILREDISEKKRFCFRPQEWKQKPAEVPERQYGLTFVGTMGDYFSQVLWIHGLERPKRFLANRFLLIMRQQPDLTLEQAFARAVEHQGLKLTRSGIFEPSQRTLCHGILCDALLSCQSCGDDLKERNPAGCIWK